MKSFARERIGLDRTDLNILDVDTADMATYIMAMAKEKSISYDYKFDEKEIEEALYWLKNTAKNPYDKDYFRQLFAALAIITDTEFYSDLKA